MQPPEESLLNLRVFLSSAVLLTLFAHSGQKGSKIQSKVLTEIRCGVQSWGEIRALALLLPDCLISSKSESRHIQGLRLKPADLLGADPVTVLCVERERPLRDPLFIVTQVTVLSSRCHLQQAGPQSLYILCLEQRDEAQAQHAHACMKFAFVLVS